MLCPSFDHCVHFSLFFITVSFGWWNTSLPSYVRKCTHWNWQLLIFAVDWAFVFGRGKNWWLWLLLLVVRMFLLKGVVFYCVRNYWVLCPWSQPFYVVGVGVLTSSKHWIKPLVRKLGFSILSIYYRCRLRSWCTSRALVWWGKSKCSRWFGLCCWGCLVYQMRSGHSRRSIFAKWYSCGEMLQLKYTTLVIFELCCRGFLGSGRIEVGSTHWISGCARNVDSLAPHCFLLY